MKQIHTAPDMASARRMARKLYGATTLHLQGDGQHWSVVVRDKLTGIDVAVIHLG